MSPERSPPHIYLYYLDGEAMALLCPWFGRIQRKPKGNAPHVVLREENLDLWRRCTTVASLYLRQQQCPWDHVKRSGRDAQEFNEVLREVKI